MCVAASGLALSLCLFVFVPHHAAAQDAPEDEPAQSEQAGPGEDGGPSGDVAEEADAPPGPWDVSEPCKGVQHPYQADLCQQWRAAEASERTAALTRLLMIIGTLATLLLLLMFVPVLMAALAARKAAQGKARASLPPRDREDELRAYVDVDTLEFIETPESDGVVKVKITFRNSGQTPAFKIETVAEMDIRDISEEDLLPVVPLPEAASADPARPRLGRDATATMIVQYDSTPKLAERVTNGESTILVWGFAKYTDVFDRRHKTAFQYLCNAETLETGQIFKPMVRGDEDG